MRPGSLHLHGDTVRRYIRERRLPAARVRRSYLIRPADLEAFVLARMTDPAAGKDDGLAPEVLARAETA